MKITILFNPAAGRGKSRRTLAEVAGVLRRAGVEPEVYESRSPEHLRELARQAREEKPDVIVAAGGDGTLHYVLNGLVGSGIPLGILPFGSGNDFAKGLGIPPGTRAAAKVLLNGRTREIDLARVGSTVYGGIAGVGFDSVVNRFANERVRRLRGSLAYAWAILRCLNSFHPQPLELRSEARNFSGEVMFTVIGNNVSYGGGVKMTPRARLDDGLLDICIVPAMGKLELLRWLPRAYRGEHLTHPRMVYFQARKIELSSRSPLELFADGEFIQGLPATIVVLPGAVRVIVPASGLAPWRAAAGAPTSPISGDEPRI